MSLLQGVGIFNSARSRRQSTRLVGIKLNVRNRARRVTKKATAFPTGPPEALQSSFSEHDDHVVDWDDGGELLGEDIEEGQRQHSSSTHQKKKEKAAEQWNTLRGSLLAAFREQLVPPQSPSCSICAEEATVRCTDCGVDVYFCEGCARRSHEEHYLYHLLEGESRISYSYLAISICM